MSSLALRPLRSLQSRAEPAGHKVKVVCLMLVRRESRKDLASLAWRLVPFGLACSPSPSPLFNSNTCFFHDLESEKASVI